MGTVEGVERDGRVRVNWEDETLEPYLELKDAERFRVEDEAQRKKWMDGITLALKEHAAGMTPEQLQADRECADRQRYTVHPELIAQFHTSMLHDIQSTIADEDTQEELEEECGGSGLCEHGRRRSNCKECGGGGPVTFLEATVVEKSTGEKDPQDWVPTVEARLVGGPRGGKRRR